MMMQMQSSATIFDGRWTRMKQSNTEGRDLLCLASVIGVLLSGCTAAPDTCGRELSRSEISEIVDRELVARYGSSDRSMQYEVEITRSNCDYIYMEEAVPAFPGGWFGMTIDKDGNVIDFMPGV